MHDYQRQKVYNWQRAGIKKLYPIDIPKPAIEIALLRAEQVTGVPITYGMNSRLRRRVYANDSGVTLASSEAAAWSRNVGTVLHEAAHYILKQKGLCDRHGGNFVGLFLQLLKHCGGTIGKENYKAWTIDALQRGIHVNPMSHLIVGETEF